MIIILSSNHLHKSKTLSQLTQCPFTGTLLLLHLNSYHVTFLYNTICRAQLFCPSVIFGISFEHAIQLPFTVLLYSSFPDNYAFLSLSPSQIKSTQSADTVPVHGHSPLVSFTSCSNSQGHIATGSLRMEEPVHTGWSRFCTVNHPDINTNSLKWHTYWILFKKCSMMLAW